MSKLLKILFITVIIKQIIWIAFIPLWQFPDEQAHFGQVAYQAEIGQLGTGQDLTNEILISERILGTERDESGNNKYTYHPEYNIPYSDTTVGFHEKEIKSIPYENRKIFVKSESTFYPPLYYLPLKMIYEIFYHQDLITRVYLIRLSNIFYTLILLWVSYKLFRLVFGNDILAFSGSILVMFQPMLSFVQGGVNSDNLFNLLFTIGIYLSLLVIKNGFQVRYILLVVLNLYLAINTKPQGNILLLTYVFPLCYLSIKNKPIRLFSLISFLLLTASYLYNFVTRRQLFFIPDTYFSAIVKNNWSLIQHIVWSIKQTEN